ncbi:MAG: hypothetical protein WC602_05940, partial [archaeon]
SKSLFWVVFVISVLGIVFFSGCSKDSLTAPEAAVTPAVEKGVPSESIQWVQWKQDAVNELAKRPAWGYDRERIKRDFGGVVGGFMTFNNMVEIPAYAFEEHFRDITVSVVRDDEDENVGAAVDFLPNQKFDKDVRVTLSYANLDFDGNPEDLCVYWLDEESNTWIEVANPEVNQEMQTISVYVNHFTRYGWGLDPEP